MTKKHTQFSSAFALNEHAEIRLDRFGQDPYPVARVDGIMFYGDTTIYRLSLFVNDGPTHDPHPFLHQGRPVDGFREDDLLPFEGVVYHGQEYSSRPDTNQNLAGAKYQMGDLVQIVIHLQDIREADENQPQATQTDFHNIPVLITSVGYEPGKVIYGVSIDRDHYRNTKAWDDAYEGRYVRDDLQGIDSVLVQPVGGWSAYYEAESNTSGRIDVFGADEIGKANVANTPKSDSDKDDGVGYMC